MADEERLDGPLRVACAMTLAGVAVSMIYFSGWRPVVGAMSAPVTGPESGDLGLSLGLTSIMLRVNALWYGFLQHRELELLDSPVINFSLLAIGCLSLGTAARMFFTGRVE